MKRLVIIEDQTAIREMLVEILRLDANYQLVGEAGDGQAAVQLCLESNPDVCILDAKLPGLNGVDILRRISKKLPQMRVLVFSGHENPVLVREMLEAGAHGFVEKTAGLFEFKKGLAGLEDDVKKDTDKRELPAERAYRAPLAEGEDRRVSRADHVEEESAPRSCLLYTSPSPRD